MSTADGPRCLVPSGAVTLRLTVDTAAWRSRVERVGRSLPGLVPVVKGNGYGFGRGPLAAIAAELASVLAVGTVHELDHVPAGVMPVVLTPALRPPKVLAAVMTVGSVRHVHALAGWTGRVLVKLASSVRRFGVDEESLGGVTAAARAAGLDVIGFSVHPPVAGGDDEHLDDVNGWVELLDEQDELWVSHLSPSAYRDLRDAWPGRRFRIRAGTALWHGDKAELHLGADVLETRPVRAGQHAGYRQGVVPGDGTLVVIGAGTAHGVHQLADGRSPFHFDRRRLALLEPLHMHTSMVHVPAGEIPPDVGDVVDVQWPLISALVDEVRWR
jgi:alanine racemase